MDYACKGQITQVRSIKDIYTINSSLLQGLEAKPTGNHYSGYFKKC